MRSSCCPARRAPPGRRGGASATWCASPAPSPSRRRTGRVRRLAPRPVPELHDLLEHALGATAVTLPPALSFPDSGFSAFHDADAGDALIVDWRGPLDGADAPGAAARLGSRPPSPASASWSRRSSPRRRRAAAPTTAPWSTAAPSARAGGSLPQLEGAVWGEGPGLAYLGLRLRQGRARHHRRFLALPSRAVIVIDHLEGAEAAVESLLAAGVRLREAGPRRLYLEKGDRTVTLTWMPGAAVATSEGAVVGRHGEAQPAPALRLWAREAAPACSAMPCSRDGGATPPSTSWLGLRADRPHLRPAPLPGELGARRATAAAAGRLAARRLSPRAASLPLRKWGSRSLCSRCPSHPRAATAHVAGRAAARAAIAAGC